MKFDNFFNRHKGGENIRKQAIILCLTFAFILIFSGTVSATNWSVGPGGNYNYNQIQAAVDGSSNTDTITVHPNGTGVYKENVKVNKNLTIKAYSANTVVNGSFTITAAGSGSKIEGFTINKDTNPSPIISENFDSVNPPALPSGWAVQVVNYDGSTKPNWTTKAGTSNPSGQLAHSTPNLVYFNSYDADVDDSARLYLTNSFDLGGSSDAELSFWMYHDTGYNGDLNDRIQVQVSTDGGTTWGDVGNPINRYDGTDGWKEHTLNITNTGFDNNDIKIGFLGISGYGNDCHIDDVTFKAIQNSGIYLSGASGCNITGNTINGFRNGIYLHSSTDNTITGNIIKSTRVILTSGIYLRRFENNILSENNISENSEGIYLHETSNGNTITGNIIKDNNDGLLLTISNSNVISKNNVSDCYEGMFLYETNNCNITNNIINDNEYGTFIYSTINTLIQGNTINGNSIYGIWLNGGEDDDSTVTGNIITNNNKYGINVDSGGNNIHYNRITGNTVFQMFNDEYTVNAQDNWWGSNDNPLTSGKLGGGQVDLINYGPWLYLTINTNPNYINYKKSSLITASFNNEFNGTTITTLDPANGHIPDGTPVSFNTEWGTITNIIPASSDTLNGEVNATYKANGSSPIPTTPVKVYANADNEQNTIYTMINILKIPTNTVVDFVHNTSGHTVDLVAHVTDSDGNPVDEGKVQFNVGSASPVTEDVHNGIATVKKWMIPSDWTAVTYNIVAIYIGSDDYLISGGENFLTVNPKATTTSVDSVNNSAGQKVDLVAHVVDFEGNPVNQGLVQFKIGTDSTVFATVNGAVAIFKGWIIPNNWITGNYNIIATYMGTINYLSSAATNTLTVNPTPTDITATEISGNKDETVNLTAILKDKLDNMLLGGKTIKFYINGVSLGSAVTNFEGVAILPYTIQENGGSYYIDAIFAGDNIFNSSTGGATLKVPKSNLYVTVTSSNNHPKVGETVKITFKVGNYGPDTANNVVLTLKIPRGMEYVSATTDTGLFTYNPTTQTITWNIGDVPVGDPKLILNTRVLQPGKYTIQPTITTATYDPKIPIIGSTTIQASNKTNNSTVPVVNAETIPMQPTGAPIIPLLVGTLMVVAGLVNTRKNL